MTEDTNATWWDGLSKRQRLMLAEDAQFGAEVADSEWDTLSLNVQLDLVNMAFLRELGR